MTPSLTFIAFVVGAFIGSFLNALLWRLHTGESILVGRSYCPKCGHVLGALDLVPIFSFLALRGRCRHCKDVIHPSYMAVELVAGALFAAFAAKAFAASPVIGPEDVARLLLSWFAASGFIVVFVYDLRYMLIPRSVTAVVTVIGFAGGVMLGQDPFLLLLAVIVGAGVFYAQYVVSRGKWIGGGDMHVGAMMGAVLGWPLIGLALFLSYVVGAFYGIALIASKQKGWKSEIPFGTFLSASAVFCMLYGESALAWYLGLLR